MEIYDIVMIVVLLGATLLGAAKGFAWQLASIASIVISYAVAFQYREPFSQSIHAEPPWNRFLAMLILFIGTSLVIWVVVRMLSGTINRLKLREFDRQVGALFGLAKGAIYCVLITLFAVTLMGDGVRTKVVRSKSGHYIANVLDRSEAVIPPEVQEVIKPYLERFNQEFNRPELGPSEDSEGLFQTPWTFGGSYSGNPLNPASGSPSNPWDIDLNPTPGTSSFGPPSGWSSQATAATGIPAPAIAVPTNAAPATWGAGSTPKPMGRNGMVPRQAQLPGWNGMRH